MYLLVAFEQVHITHNGEVFNQFGLGATLLVRDDEPQAPQVLLVREAAKTRSLEVITDGSGGRRSERPRA